MYINSRNGIILYIIFSIVIGEASVILEENNWKRILNCNRRRKHKNSIKIPSTPLKFAFQTRLIRTANSYPYRPRNSPGNSVKQRFESTFRCAQSSFKQKFYRFMVFGIRLNLTYEKIPQILAKRTKKQSKISSFPLLEIIQLDYIFLWNNRHRNNSSTGQRFIINFPNTRFILIISYSLELIS